MSNFGFIKEELTTDNTSLMAMWCEQIPGVANVRSSKKSETQMAFQKY